MLQLLYVSSAAQSMEAETLLQLLKKNRRRTKRLGVTGLLLYREGAFMEIIEGDEKTVRRLFDAIKAEKHHRDVTLLYEGAVDARSFPDWSMSFRSLGNLRKAAIPGFSPFADPPSLADRLSCEAGVAEHAVRTFMRTNPQHPGDHAQPA